MRFSTFIVGTFACAPLALVFCRSVAAEVANPVLEEDVVAVSELEPHVAPTFWTFELDQDVNETPELVAEIQEAFVLSANDVHDTADIIFSSVQIKQILHEMVDLRANEMIISDAMEEGDNDAGEDNADASGMLRGGLKADVKKWRMRYRASSSVTCRLCPDDRLASMWSPEFLGSRFYNLEEQVDTLKRWEKDFCGKLKKIKSLKKPTRCFISVDFDHLDSLAEPITDTVLSVLES